MTACGAARAGVCRIANADKLITATMTIAKMRLQVCRDTALSSSVR